MNANKRTVGPLSLRASVGTLDTAKRTVELTWSVGAKVLRSSWLDGPFYEELSMDPAHVRMARLQSGNAPFLADHDGSSVARTLGVVESAAIKNGVGFARVRFAAEGVDPNADLVFAKIADGVIRNVSVGYRTYKVEKTEGDTQIPTLRAVDWEPYEISAVAMGADPAASFRSAEQTNQLVILTRSNEGNNMKHKRQQQDESNGGGGVDQLAAQERERVAGIKAAVRSAQLGTDVSTKLIASGATLLEARGAVLEIMAARSEAQPPSENGSNGISMGMTEGENFVRGATSALLMRSAPDVVRAAKAANVPGFETVDTGHNHYRSLSLFDLARATLERNGVRTGSLGRLELAGRAFTMRRDGGPFAGTADFPVLLENALGKILLGAYATTPDTWSKICKTESVDDFRASPRYRSGSLSVLDSLFENGEFKNKAIPDGAKLSISTATKGNIVSVSRQLVVNDDMSALADLLAKMGRASRLSIEVDFYALLAQNGGLGPTVNGQPFFHSQNANVATSAALTAAGLDADRVTLGSQKDAQGNEYLDLRPNALLVPLSLGSTARILNTSAINPDSNGKIQQPNYVQGLVREVVDSPRISGTRRYLFGAPDVAPAFVVAFLNGQQSPTIESEQGWRVDGTEMKVRLDYLVQAFDVKGAVTNAGV